MRKIFVNSIALLATALACAVLLAGDKSYKDGVYTGAAKGYIGPINVEVTVKDGKIADIKILKHDEDRPKKALVEIPKRIIAAQKTEVDAVTGATFTSKGICRAVDAALASGVQAGKVQGGK